MAVAQRGVARDVAFGFQTCVLAGPDPDGDASDAYPYKKLLAQKLGWTALLMGDADDDALAFARGALGKETGAESRGTESGRAGGGDDVRGIGAPRRGGG